MNIPIFLSSDNNYAPFVATTIASICDNTKSFCDFYILDGGISQENKDKICDLKNQFDNFSIEFIEIEAEKKFENFPTISYITKSMYSRLLIPYLKLNLDKVIYSDVDVIVLGDIKEMYDEDLEDFIIGAIWQELYDKTINMDNLKLKLNISTEHKFFFSGNLLINCKKWREQNITQKLIDLFNKNKNLILTCPDQDLLNMFFDNNYKILSSKYCYVNQNFDYFKEEYPNIIIRHYNGQIKPWNINENTKTSLFHNLKEFWYYAKITRFFKELDKKTQNKVEQQKYIRQMQYWKNVNKITKILDRSKI